MEDKKVEVFRLDLSHLPSSRSAPKYTGFEDNLYALTKPVVAGVVQQALETDVLQRIDSEAARVLRKINTTGFADLTPEDLRVWVCFIMLLLWRTPDTVSRLHTEAPDHLKISLDERPGEYDSIAENFDPPTLAEWTEEHIPGFIENFGIINLPNWACNSSIGTKILSMKWWLWNFSGQQNHLLLADRPCIFTAGIDDPNLVIALPISPWKAFMATKTDRVANIMSQQRPKDLLMRMNGCRW